MTTLFDPVTVCDYIDKVLIELDEFEKRCNSMIKDKNIEVYKKGLK